MVNITDSLSRYWIALDQHTDRQHRIALAVIVISGFLLRFYSLHVGQAYTYFAINDEVTALQYALGLLSGDSQMLYLGSPVLNQGNIPGPLWTLLIAVLYLLGGSSAEGAVFGMVVLNSLAIYIVYKLASAFMPGRYALLSTLLFATSPWAIYYTAGLYNPNPLVLLGGLLFLNLWRATHTDNSKAIFWVCLLAAAIPQFHMIGIFYLPVILLVLFLSTARINIRWFIFGALAGLLLYLPYLIGDYLNDWQNTRAILNGNSPFSFGIFKIITIPIAMLANHPGQWAGPTFDEFKIYANQYFGSYILLIIINLISLILAATFLISLLRKTWRYLRDDGFRLRESYHKHPVILFTAIIVLLPLLLYTLTGRAYTTRYSIILFPLLFLMPALFLIHYPAGRVKNIVIYSLAFLLYVNVYMVLSFYQDQDYRIKNSTVFMPSFSTLEHIKDTIDSATKPFDKIEFIYSDTINKLPEGQRKLYKTIKGFIVAYSTIPSSSTVIRNPRKFLITDKHTTNEYHNAQVIYTSPSITILEITDIRK